MPSGISKNGINNGRFKKGFIPWNKGRKNNYPAWNKGIKMDDYPNCGFQKGHKNFSPIGEKHYRWIEDRNILIFNKRNDPEYKQWVKKVKKRDMNKCRLEDENCSGYKIVHHIKGWEQYPELRYIINNGITLCHAHHPRKRAEEKQLAPFLNGLIAVNV